MRNISCILHFRMSSSSFDAAARFMCIMAKPGRTFMEFDDFLPLVQVYPD